MLQMSSLSALAPLLAPNLALNLSPTLSPPSTTPSPQFPCSSDAPRSDDQSAGSSRLNLDSALALQRCFLHGTLRSGPITAAGQYPGVGERGGAFGAWGGDSGRGPSDGGEAFSGHDFGNSASSSRAAPATTGCGGGDFGAVQVSRLDAAPAQGHDRGGPPSARSERWDRSSSVGDGFGEFESGGGGGEEYPHLAAPIGSHEPGDVYEHFYTCRQCWASKCRGL
jgi:hypothetical protein